MRLTPEQATFVRRALNPDSLANRVEDQLGGELSDESYARFTSALTDAALDVLCNFDFQLTP